MDKVIDTGTRDLLKGQNTWPKKKTAFLIIHGIGEQNPFETLDVFVRGFFNVLDKMYPGQIITKHRTKPRTGDNKLGWVESFISLVKKDQQESYIDFYEYYWAYRMEGEITFPELVDWLIKTSDGARKFYETNEEIVKKYEEAGDDAFKKGRFKKRWYLKHLGWFLRLVTSPIIYRIISKIPYWGSIFNFVNSVLGIFFLRAKKLFVDYMGDVAIYTTTDVKSKHYYVRKSILDDSVKEVKTLIDGERYENIIIAGHSLGSVIAYDTLNKVVQRVNEEQDEWCSAVTKISGLITFGSPLDKTAFFFREHTAQDQCVRRQMLAQLHCFKNKDLNLKDEKIRVEGPYEKMLDNTVQWINFWDEKDTVSGQLDFYVVDENIKLDMGKKYGISHTAYWEYEKMYSKICERFLR